MTSIANHMVDRIKSHLSNVLEVDEDIMEKEAYQSTMGKNCSRLVINLDTYNPVDLSPLYNRYETGDKLLSDKEVDRDIYLGGIADGGLSFIMAPHGETPDAEFENR